MTKEALKLSVIATSYKRDALALLDIFHENTEEFGTESALSMLTSVTLKLKLILMIENTQDRLNEQDLVVVRADLLALDTTESIAVARMLTQIERGETVTM